MIIIGKNASVPSEIGFEGIYSIISRWKKPEYYNISEPFSKGPYTNPNRIYLFIIITSKVLSNILKQC